MTPTGIPALDEIWEGFAPGSAYLLCGRADHGRDLLSLHQARAAIDRGADCVYVSPRHPVELAGQAAGIGFDIATAAAGGHLRLLRPPHDIAADGSDDVVADALAALGRLIAEVQPEMVVIEDFSPFAGFSRLSRLTAAAELFLEEIATGETVVLIGLGEPACDRSRRVVAALWALSAGALHLSAGEADDTTTRRVALLPVPGSMQQPVEAELDLGALTERSVTALPVPAGDGASARTAAPMLAVGVAEADGVPALEPVPPSETASEPEVPSLHFGEEEPEEANIEFLNVEDPWILGPGTGDPFAEVAVPEGPASGHYVVGKPSGPGGAEHAPAGEVADDRPSEEGAVPGRDPSAARARFLADFDEAREAWMAGGAPFVILAFRIDPDRLAADDVPQLEELVRGVAGDASLAADASGRRVVLLMSGEKAEAMRLLERLRREVHARFPHLSPALARAIGTIVLAQGEPFPSGSALVDHVFGSE